MVLVLGGAAPGTADDFSLDRVGIGVNLGGVVEDCWLDVAPRAGIGSEDRLESLRNKSERNGSGRLWH